MQPPLCHQQHSFTRSGNVSATQLFLWTKRRGAAWTFFYEHEGNGIIVSSYKDIFWPLSLPLEPETALSPEFALLKKQKKTKHLSGKDLILLLLLWCDRFQPQLDVTAGGCHHSIDVVQQLATESKNQDEFSSNNVRGHGMSVVWPKKRENLNNLKLT